tara:strand:- start:148 stop:705 length:558 start_codon:yes stop_codon:yes gene_type:complete
MPISREREKLLNALIFISENVDKRSKTKYYKLLNFCDFKHFEKTGRSITGLQYNALERGPVPLKLHEELDHPKPDFIQHLLKRRKDYGGGYEALQLEPRKQFNADYFSPFELEILTEICKRHFSDSASEISEFSHFETGPWHEVWEVQGNRNGPIPYELVIERRNNQLDQAVMQLANERSEMFQV